MEYLVAAIFGAIALPAMFFGYLYCQEHQIVPVLTVAIGAAVGCAPVFLFHLTH